MKRYLLMAGMAALSMLFLRPALAATTADGGQPQRSVYQHAVLTPATASAEVQEVRWGRRYGAYYGGYRPYVGYSSYYRPYYSGYSSFYRPAWGYSTYYRPYWGSGYGSYGTYYRPYHSYSGFGNYSYPGYTTRYGGW